MKIFDIDSPLMQSLTKVADLMILNLLTIVCCIPVITAGPALTALNYMALKIVRNEECYIVKGFFKSFKENLFQGIVVWLLALLMAAILVSDYVIMGTSGLSYAGIMQAFVIVMAVFVISTLLYVFPVMAKFQNTIKNTVKNAFLISLMQFPKTVVMFVVYAIPVWVFLNLIQLFPFVLFFGLSVPAWLSAKLYNKVFKKLEDRYWETQKGNEEEHVDGDEEDVRIFRDELDETLQERK